MEASTLTQPPHRRPSHARLPPARPLPSASKMESFATFFGSGKCRGDVAVGGALRIAQRHGLVDVYSLAGRHYSHGKVPCRRPPRLLSPKCAIWRAKSVSKSQMPAVEDLLVRTVAVVGSATSPRQGRWQPRGAFPLSAAPWHSPPPKHFSNAHDVDCTRPGSESRN